jgi:predicted DNA binding CopG/RHH family protein
MPEKGSIMNKKLRKIPKFRSEDDEREFWARNSPLDFIGKKEGIVIQGLPNLKPSTEQISLRMAKMMLERLKIVANRKDVPYQSLAKVYIERGIKEDMVVNGAK